MGFDLRTLLATNVQTPFSLRAAETDSRIMHHSSQVEIHGTTVIAVKYRNGVLNVGDRRATANFAVMYDKAEKVLPIDDFTLLAISGSATPSSTLSALSYNP
jgi:20S proteasome alpha/beta subunit